MPETAFALIHSPLVGPVTWQSVAESLQQIGYRAVVPVLCDDVQTERPFWERHSGIAGVEIARLPDDQPVVLVAHSGAGPLLPAIRMAIRQPVAAYIFVDAGLPHDGASRVDLIRAESTLWADEFESMLRQGGSFPNWQAEDLTDLIPDKARRLALVESLQPRGLNFFTEPLPVFATWPDAPCVYLQWSKTYASYASKARSAGWLVKEHQAGHFHMLVDPSGVARTLIEVLHSLYQTL